MDPADLSSFEVFAELSDGERATVLGAATELSVEAGTELVRRGEFGYALYAIELGEADVIGDEGTRIGSLAPGDTFGEIAMLVTGKRTASVVARTPMRLLTFFAADLERIRAGLPAVDRALRRLGGARLERSGAGDA